MKKTLRINNLKTKDGGISNKTGAKWFFYEWTDDDGERWSAPNFLLDFTPIEGKEYNVIYENVKNGKFVNKRISSMGTVPNTNKEEKPLQTQNNANNSPQNDRYEALMTYLEQIALDIQEIKNKVEDIKNNLSKRP